MDEIRAIGPPEQLDPEKMSLGGGYWAFEKSLVRIMWGHRLAKVTLRVRSRETSTTGFVNELSVDEISVRDLAQGLPAVESLTIPLGKLRRVAMAQAVYLDEERANEELVDLPQEVVELPVAGRRRKLTDDLLREVAEIYRAAIAEGRHPTTAVRDALMVSHSQAAKYVSRARKRGYLGPTSAGRAGEH